MGCPLLTVSSAVARFIKKKKKKEYLLIKMLSPGVVLFGQLLCTVGVGGAGRSADTTSVHCNYSL